ncbi:MAG: hypothetical protein ACT4PO_05670 [Actinomycetota bacterium]
MIEIGTPTEDERERIVEVMRLSFANGARTRARRYMAKNIRSKK